MLFGAPSGTQGNVINAGVNELDPAELQADLGQYPEDFRCPGFGSEDVVQVLGLRGILRQHCLRPGLTAGPLLLLSNSGTP